MSSSYATAVPVTALLAAVVTLTSAGCAARRTPTTLTDALIKRGEPAVSLDVDAPEENSLQRYMARVRRVAEQARPAVRTPQPKHESPPSAEGTNLRLKEALGRLEGGETPEGHRRAAAAYVGMGILDAAYRHLSAALRLDPRSGGAYDARARLWRAWGFPRLGLADAHRAVYFAPHSAAAWNTLGTLLHASGDRDAAKVAYEQTLALDLHAAYAWGNLCSLAAEGGAVIEASRVCTIALRLDPTLMRARADLQRALVGLRAQGLDPVVTDEDANATWLAMARSTQERPGPTRTPAGQDDRRPSGRPGSINQDATGPTAGGSQTGSPAPLVPHGRS